jgi:hypothetical protein
MFLVGVSPARAATIAVKNVKRHVLNLTVVVDIRSAGRKPEVARGATKRQGGDHGIHRQNARRTLTGEETR